MADTSADADRLLGGRLLLRQPRKGHRAGTDTILLSAAAGSPAGHLIDMGAGVGTAGLAVALRCPGLRVTLVEIDAELATLARENVTLNDLDARVSVILADVLSPATRRDCGLEGAGADCVLTNPPWYAPAETQASPDATRARAHVGAATPDDPDGIDRWLRAAAAMLRPGGKLVMIHRAAQLASILEAARDRFGAIAIRPVQPKAGTEAKRILVHAVRGSRAPLRLLAPIVVHEADGRFTPEAEALHRGETTLEVA